MYLSQLLLNPRNAQVRTELARPYELHRTLLRAFPQGGVGVARDGDDAAGVLFRVDESPRNHRIVVLVQSKTAPDWSFLDGKRDARGHAYLLPAPLIGDGKLNPATTEFDVSKKIHAGQTLAFRLRANPTKRLGKSAGDDHHKRVGIYDEDKQLEWLREKLEGNPEKHRPPSGFHIVRAMVSRDEKIENQEAIHRDNRTHDLKLLSVLFDGILQVADVERASQAIERGVGSAKGFGFGLLSLAPA